MFMRRANRWGLLGALFVGCAAPPEPPQEILDERGLVTPLRCPSGPGCAQGEGPLLVGRARRAITPVVEGFEDANENGRFDDGERFEDLNGNGRFDPVWIAGFGSGRQARGVHDDNWSRALVLEQGDLRLGLVSLDLVGYFHDDVIKLREAARSLGFDHLLVASTHQHEGADSMGPWGADAFTSGRDPAYMQRIIDQTIEALAEALDGLEPATLRVAQTETPELIADSRLPEVIDPTLTAVLFEGSQGPIASLSILGNHPEALGGRNQQITSDYPHYLREALEARYPGTVSVFFAGTLGGLMNPLNIAGCPDSQGRETCGNGTFEKAEYVGIEAAAAAIRALDADALIDDEPKLAFRRQGVLFGLGNGLFFSAYLEDVIQRQAFSREGRALPKSAAESVPLMEVLEGGLRLRSEVNAISLGPLALLAVPGELYPELWLSTQAGSLIERPEGADFPGAPQEIALRSLMPQAKMHAIINQANDALGYIIPKAQYDRASPRAYEPDGQYGEENSLGPEIAPELLEAVQLLMAERAPD